MKKETASAIPPFTGFSPRALGFFRALAGHQDKAWFAEHKAEYEEEILKPMTALVVELSARLAAAGLNLRGDPRSSLFRLHRDVRFSMDKRPFKTHASAVLTPDARKHSPGVLYFHLDPDGSFAASGFFQPETPTLHLMRRGLAEDPAGWKKVERSLASRSLNLDREGALIRIPRDFSSAPAEVADSLKLKSWVVRRKLTQAQLATSGLLDLLVGLARDAAPLLEFGWAAISGG